MRRDLKSIVQFCTLGTAALVGLAACAPVGVSSFGRDVVTVSIKTVDPNGASVPWVTIGAAWTPYPLFRAIGSSWPALQPDDLRRLLLRNPAAWEYWNTYVKGPAFYLNFGGLSDQHGLLKDQIDYANAKGSKWPDEVLVTYGAYRYGYKPATAQIKVHKEDRGLEITLVLEPDSSAVTPLPDYLQTHYEIRHELADWRRNEGISHKNHERLENIRTRLIEAAQTASAKGDRRAAAQIMYWVAYLPEIPLYKGKPNGYSQTTESLRNYEAIKKAAEYDPDNFHVQAQAMLYESWWWDRERVNGRITWDDTKKLRREWLDRAIALDKRAEQYLDGRFHEQIALTYGFLDMTTEEIAKLEWLKNYDPSWQSNLDARIGRIKKRLEENKLKKEQ